MAHLLVDLFDSVGRVSRRVGLGVVDFLTWLENIKTAPAGVPQDLWEAGLRSLVLHLRDARLTRPYIVTLVDYRIDADSTRLWTIDLRTKRVELSALVAHGGGNGANPRNRVVRVSNEAGSEMSSVGAFVTDTATYESTAGQRNHARRRTALRIHGLDPTNFNAYDRAVVFHGAHYVSPNRAGRSEGCFATQQEVNDELIPLILGGTFVFSYFG